MFLKGVWFIIAGFLLFGHTPALAEQFLRVCKNGVVYYYFASREPAQSRQTGINNPKLRGEAWIQAPSPHHNLPYSSPKTPIRVGSKVSSNAISPSAGPDLGQLMPGASDELHVVKPYDVKENIGAGTRYLVKLLSKLGGYSRPVWPAYDAGPYWTQRHRDVPAIQEPQIVAQDARLSLKKYPQEQRLDLGHMTQGSRYLGDANLAPYCFPVAGPFSFRDTWGEYRSRGRHHRAVDIFAREGTEVYAVTSGIIQSLAILPEAGITLQMRGQDGRGYGYMHLQGYAPGIVEGKVVRTGELICYVGRTGLQESAAHLHFQVYADHRLCKDDLLNPYNFLVQLCNGIGVTDLYQHRVAQIEDQKIKTNRIKVYRRSVTTALRTPKGQPAPKNSSILVIKNF
jgi:murein DD-endopeptidase MepM/ murein hydrolase activator NlpD